MPAFSLAQPPRLDHSAASPAARRSPTHQQAQSTRQCHDFGGVLEPRYIVGAESLDQ